MSTLNPPRNVNLQQLLDHGRLQSFQLRVIILCAIVALLDGFDTQMLGVMAPSISADLGIDLKDFGPIFSAALLGYMVGSMVIGPVADYIGRKWCMILSVVTFGGFTVASAFATAFEHLVVLRFLAGLGLGAASPCFLALTSEYAPLKNRATILTLLWAAFPLGGMAAGFLSSALIPIWGWQSIFVVGGLIPMVFVLVLVALLPESVRLTFAKKGDGHATRALVEKIAPELRGSEYVVSDSEQAPSQASYKQLFASGIAGSTLLLWGAFFCTFCVMIAVGTWAPALLRQAGMSLAQSASVLAAYNIGGIIGTVLLGRLIDRFGAPKVLFTSLLIGTACLAPLGYVADSFVAVALSICGVGLFIGGAGAGMIALSAMLYPVASRATGIGWALGVGRLGSVLGPVIGGALLQRDLPMPGLFAAMCVLTLTAAALIAVLGFRSAARRRVEGATSTSLV